MKTLSKMSTTTKVILAGGAAVGVYFAVRHFTKKEEPKTPAISPTGQPTGGGLPPAQTGQARPPASPAVPYNADLQSAEAAMANAYHAQWAGGNLESRVSQVLGTMPETVSGEQFENYKRKLINALTDWTYQDVYGDAVFPIPKNWAANPGWQPYAQAWSRIHKQMSLLVNTTFSQGNDVA